MNNPSKRARRNYEIVPGVGIGPFRLGMTEAEIAAICREHGLQNDGVIHGDLGVEFEDDHAVRITASCNLALSIGREQLTDSSDENVQRLLALLAPPGKDWTEMAGLMVFHWEFSDTFVFAFMVYAPGHRDARR